MMSGKPLDLQELPTCQRHSSEGRHPHPGKGEFIIKARRNSRPSSRGEISGFPLRRIAAGRGSIVPRVSAIPFPGLILKRILDVILSCAALLLLWPFLLVIALAVKLESSGPVLYASLRAGQKGKRFVCYKFRTMVDKADELKSLLRHFNERQDPFFKMANDPRVTRLGRFLRKYSLDELPQFWNVLKGNMSLVGPRPHPIDDYTRYRPGDHRRLEVKPGITGLWQVMARTSPSFDTCIALDLAYIKQWGLLLDFKILMRTVPAVLSGEGS
jgi:lipopolysaccharide/colanic/teichoic acid biosynthesis glycosyltransferase